MNEKIILTIVIACIILVSSLAAYGVMKGQEYEREEKNKEDFSCEYYYAKAENSPHMQSYASMYVACVMKEQREKGGCLCQ